MPRDNFTQKTIRIIAMRSGYRCSNPDCRCVTTGPHSDSSRSINIGVAAHICAAAPGGPRYDDSQTEEHRTSPENGIWLCQTCSRFIDGDKERYTVKLLQEWKHDSEQAALKEAEEEAGLHGTIDGESVHAFEYEKRHRRMSTVAFLMKVTRCADTWDEAAQRDRCWATYEEAEGLIEREELLTCLELGRQKIVR